MEILLTDVRLAFPSLWVPTAFTDKAGNKGELKFKATLLIPKTDRKQMRLIDDSIQAVALTKWEKKAKGILDSIKGNPNRYNVQDGDLKEYSGFADHWAVIASNKVRPAILDRKRNADHADSGLIYAGCYVNARIEFFAYVNPAPGISASLNGVQFVRDGDAFTGGRPSRAEDFPDLSDQDGGEEEALA